MGIRYYAYPIAAEDVEAASADPCAYHGTDPLMDAWGPPDRKPEMLYLDKAWNELQRLLGSETGGEPRVAFRLVEGSVTHIGYGWIPFERVLRPDEVRRIAEDLAQVTDDDISRMIASQPRLRTNDVAEEFAYVSQYLDNAKRFARELARDGRGLVYLIG